MTPEEVRAIVREENELVVFPQCKGRHALAMNVATQAKGIAQNAHDRGNEAKRLAEANADKLITITNAEKGGILDVMRDRVAGLDTKFESFRERYDTDRIKLFGIAALIVAAIFWAPDLKAWVGARLGFGG